MWRVRVKKERERKSRRFERRGDRGEERLEGELKVREGKGRKDKERGKRTASGLG